MLRSMRFTSRLPVVLSAALFSVGCGTPAGTDASIDDGAIALDSSDAASSDGSSADATASDATATDGPASDRPANDGGPVDAFAGDGAARDAGPPCSACVRYAAPMALGRVSSALINEASGIAASRDREGVYYVHNDSGDSARFFALDPRGALLGEYHLNGATATDWEDMAVGPCPSGSCAYLADIGDNLSLRSRCVIYRVHEPAPTAPSTTPIDVAFERFPFVYPDGAHNAETILVNPENGDVYIVTKVATGPSAVYRYPAPLRPDVQVTLTRVTSIDAPAGGSAQFTGGSVHPCGDRILLRVYDRLYEYPRAPMMPFESVFTAMPTRVVVAPEPQGEAVTYQRDGRGYVTVSEGGSPALNASACMP